MGWCFWYTFVLNFFIFFFGTNRINFKTWEMSQWFRLKFLVEIIKLTDLLRSGSKFFEIWNPRFLEHVSEIYHSILAMLGEYVMILIYSEPVHFCGFKRTLLRTLFNLLCTTVTIFYFFENSFFNYSRVCKGGRPCFTSTISV